MPLSFKDPCGKCGSTAWIKWQKRGGFECCSDCTVIPDTTPRDAVGQPVRIPTENLGKYSYATDMVMNSDRKWADLLRRNNLGMKEG